MAGLKKALNELNEAVKDLTSLHVQTFTGTIESEIDESTPFKSIKTMVETAVTSGKATLVADSLSQFDGDSYNFVSKDLENVPRLALEVHKNAVTAGIETRLGLLKLFKELIDDIA